MSGIKQQHGEKDLKSNVTMKREEDATLVLTAWTEQVFIYSMITVGEALPCLNTLHATGGGGDSQLSWKHHLSW